MNAELIAKLNEGLAANGYECNVVSIISSEGAFFTAIVDSDGINEKCVLLSFPDGSVDFYMRAS